MIEIIKFKFSMLILFKFTHLIKITKFKKIYIYIYIYIYCERNNREVNGFNIFLHNSSTITIKSHNIIITN